MPRSGGGRRSSGGGARSAPSRSASTSNVPARQPQQQDKKAAQVPAHAPQPQAQQPGFFGNMMSTAAGVGMGSVVGHGISNALFGSSSESGPVDSQAPASGDYNQQSGSPASCDAQSKDFLACLNATGNDMNSCSFYLEQLKACQSMTSRV